MRTGRCREAGGRVRAANEGGPRRDPERRRRGARSPRGIYRSVMTAGAAMLSRRRPGGTHPPHLLGRARPLGSACPPPPPPQPRGAVRGHPRRSLTPPSGCPAGASASPGFPPLRGRRAAPRTRVTKVAGWLRASPELLLASLSRRGSPPGEAGLLRGRPARGKEGDKFNKPR